METEPQEKLYEVGNIRTKIGNEKKVIELQRDTVLTSYKPLILRNVGIVTFSSDCPATPIWAHRDANSAGLIDIVCQTVRDFCGSAPQSDNITRLYLHATEN